MYSAALTSALPPKMVRLPPIFAAVSVDGGKSRKGGNLFSVQLPEFGKSREEGAGVDRTYSFECSSEGFPFSSTRGSFL